MICDIFIINNCKSNHEIGTDLFSILCMFSQELFCYPQLGRGTFYHLTHNSCRYQKYHSDFYAPDRTYLTILISLVLNLSSQIPILNYLLPENGDKEENNLRCYEGIDWRIVTCDHGACVKISTMYFGTIPGIAGGRICIPRKAWEEREVHSLTFIHF